MIYDVRPWITWTWAAVAVFWLMAALRRKPTARKQSTAGRTLEIAVMIVWATLLFYQWPHVALLNRRILPATAGVEFFGIALTAAGALVAITARAYLGANWSGRPSIKEGHELIRKGPYALVRHPIYSGLLLAAAGTAIAFGEIRSLLALPVMLGGFWLKIGVEERLLSEAMGGEYSAYRAAVRSAIIPFIL
jgi:protein-S-isoprenylcysteine O-methyltransferase Ste14